MNCHWYHFSCEVSMVVGHVSARGVPNHAQRPIKIRFNYIVNSTTHISTTISMISHSNCNFLMDWEPTENYDMDVDVTQGPFSFEDCDVSMASPSPPSVQDIHMASPILTPQFPSISEIALFLPPLEMKTTPAVFPFFSSHAVSCQALEPLAYPREIKAVPLDDFPFVYIPAVSNCLPEPLTMFSATCRADNFTPAVHNHNQFPSNSVYRPVTPSPRKSRTTFRESDISDEEDEIVDRRSATPSPLIKSTSCAGWSEGLTGSRDMSMDVDCTLRPDSIDEQNVTPSAPYLIAETYTPEWIDEQDVTPRIPVEIQNEWINEDIMPSTPHLVAETNTLEWIDEQDATPSTPQPVVAETNTPKWLADEDVTSISQNPILETATPFHLPEVPLFQEFVDPGADLIDLWDPSFEGSNFDKDESVLRSFSASSLKDLEWILEAFHATTFTDACIESKSASNSFEAMFIPAPLHNQVLPYDWAVSEAGPDLISFDSADGLHHNIQSGSFKLPSLESGEIIQYESNGLFQTSTPASYNRSASPDVQSCSALYPLVFFNKATNTVERNAPRSTERDASTQTEELPGATYGTSFLIGLVFNAYFAYYIRSSLTTPIFALREIFSLSEAEPRFFSWLEQFWRFGNCSALCLYLHVLWSSIPCGQRLPRL